MSAPIAFPSSLPLTNTNFYYRPLSIKILSDGIIFSEDTLPFCGWTLTWVDRNVFGNNKCEAKDLLRMRTVERVKYLYQNPPRLDRRYAAIRTIPLESRLKCSTTTLQRWIKRVEHCTFVTKFLRDNPAHRQLTIPQAYARALRSESALKYPPWPDLFIMGFHSWGPSLLTTFCLEWCYLFPW